MLDRNNFQDLPTETLLLIFLSTTPETIVQTLRFVNKQFYTAAYAPFLWQKKLEDNFSHVYTMNDGYAKFNEVYRAEYKDLLSPIKRLFSLVKEGDVEGLNIELKKNKDLSSFLDNLDQEDKNDLSILEWAHKKKNQMLLNYFYQIAIAVYQKETTSEKTIVDTQKIDSKKRTILHWAVRCHKLDAIPELIKQGADIHSGSNGGSTPLHFSAAWGFSDVAAVLLKEKANINKVNNNIETPLHFAASEGHLDVVNLLLDNGAVIDAVNKNYKTPLYFAVRSDHLSIVEVLVRKGANIYGVPMADKIPVLYAAQKGNLDILKFFLKNGATIHTANSKGKTLLHFAAQNGYFHVVNYLLKKGAIINAVNHYGRTALHFAAQNGNLEIVNILLEKGAHIDAVDHRGKTPIELASQNNQAEVVLSLSKKALLNYEAKTNARNDNDYKTSLTIFGRKINFGPSAQEEKEAIKALKSVVFEGAEPNCLVYHERVLNNDELRKICHYLKISYPPLKIFSQPWWHQKIN